MLLEISYRYESFLYGLDHHYVVSQPPITHHLKSLYKKFIHENGEQKDQEWLEATIFLRDNILKNAQNGWISKSEIELTQLTASISQSKFSEPIQFLMQSQDWPLEAFIEYQKQQFNAAEFLLEKAIQADWLLESKYHFKEILFHRIHLIHNLAKVLLKKNDIKGAIKKIWQLMIQIAMPDKDLFSPPIQIEQNPTSIEYLTLLFHHLSDSLALINKENPEFVLEIIGLESFTNNTFDNSFNQSLNNIYSLIKNRNITNHSIDSILKSGNIQYAGFWYTALAILHKFSEENEPQFATSIIKKLIEKNAPAYWIGFVKSL